jgi:acyl carrier protein
MESLKRSGQVKEMIDHIMREIIRRTDIHIAENTRLVSSGLIDSLALVDLLLRLEEVTQTRIPASKVQPKDMDTIALMLDTAERLGKPRSS